MRRNKKWGPEMYATKMGMKKNPFAPSHAFKGLINPKLTYVWYSIWRLADDKLRYTSIEQSKIDANFLLVFG